DELEIFAEACRTASANMLTAHDGNIAVAMVYAALKSIDENAAMVSIDDVITSAKSEL
ncbi:MAG: hypothetical protein HOJ97_08415, partial [Alphaproteobacteria bacterium]|nr:hypothetical protein [Alphaproteobacteria bacterium]